MTTTVIEHRKNKHRIPRVQELSLVKVHRPLPQGGYGRPSWSVWVWMLHSSFCCHSQVFTMLNFWVTVTPSKIDGGLKLNQQTGSVGCPSTVWFCWILLPNIAPKLTPTKTHVTMEISPWFWIARIYIFKWLVFHCDVQLSQYDMFHLDLRPRFADEIGVVHRAAWRILKRYDLDPGASC